MSNKVTILIGYKTPRPANWETMTITERMNSDWHPESFHRSGWWKPETLARAADRAGIKFERKATHVRMDYSGKGRTYDANKFAV